MASYSGQGGLTKVGTGTFTLDGDGSGFDGQTAVDAGTLLFGGPLGTGSVSVQDGATLGGSGIIGGDVSVSGTLQGIQGQTLTMGSLTLGSPARTDVTLGTPGGASLFDVGGDLTLDGTLNIADAGGFGAGVYRLLIMAARSPMRGSPSARRQIPPTWRSRPPSPPR